VSAKPGAPCWRKKPLAHTVHCESVVEVQVRALSQLVTPVHLTQESETPSWRKVPLSHAAHCELEKSVQLSGVTQLAIGLQATHADCPASSVRK
jgi:hypothetical protein